MEFFFKFIAANISQFLLRILQIIPLKKNRIVFLSCNGDQYSCNPKYISEYLENNYSGKFDIVWLLNNPEQFEFLNKRGLKTVKNSFYNKWIYELTARISINNMTCHAWMPLRKNQLHICTWHGGGYYKLCGVNEKEKNNFEKRLVIMSSKNTSYFLSTNQCFTDNEIRLDFCYNGDVLNIGYPRNDIFFHGDYESIRKAVSNYFGISEDVKIIVYAPTYRYETDIKFMPDFKKIEKAASERFGGEWAVLTRAHYLSTFQIDDSDTYDATYRPDAPDMQELLMACDMLISDYSSCIWDYSFTYRPCFLFTPDLEEYTKDRGFGIDIYEWGFPVCKTEDELFDAIKTFDPDAFRLAMEKHHKDLGSFENGNASEIMGDLIYNFCFPETQSK